MADALLLDGVTGTESGEMIVGEDDNIVAMEVVIGGTATVTFEGKLEDGSWRAIEATDYGDPQAAGSTTTSATGLFQVPAAGLHKVRARVSAHTSGPVTVRATAGRGAPLPR